MGVRQTSMQAGGLVGRQACILSAMQAANQSVSQSASQSAIYLHKQLHHKYRLDYNREDE